MALLVQKFGGTSVGTLERIRHVAQRVQHTRQQGHDVVVVVSAMHGETDRLIQLAESLSPNPHPREYDVLVSTGEQVSMALLSMALNLAGCPARSCSGVQLRILTDDFHTNARILAVETDRIRKDLAEGFVVVVAGFQGVNGRGDITTLGRGGSDTTAVALAAALAAKECQIYTDVEGVYTTDPAVLPEAVRLPVLSFDEMLELASLGAKVLQMRSVELASHYNIPLRVLSTFTEGKGTLITAEETLMQKHVVSGIAFSREEAILSLGNVPWQPGTEGRILSAISEAHIGIDMIAQNLPERDTTDFTFTLHRRDYPRARKIIAALAAELGASSQSSTTVAKLSVVGIGMRSHTGVAGTMFNALGKAGIPIQMITTSEIRISVIISEDHLDQGIRVVHEAFRLHALPIPDPDRVPHKNLIENNI